MQNGAGHGKALRKRMLLIGAWIIGLAVFWAIVEPLYRQSSRQPRPQHAIVKGDLHTVSRAIETYYVENGSYPAWSAEPENNAFGRLAVKCRTLAGQPTFLLTNGAGPRALTTPVAYLSAYFDDPYAPIKGATFCYWSTERSWLLWSPGPDREYDLTLTNIPDAFDFTTFAPSAALLEDTYDPSNGLNSKGDIWWAKQ